MGLFKKHTIMGKLFKRKAGGTKIGNLIRFGVNKATNGILGNGMLKVHESESTQVANDRALQQAGAVGYDLKTITESNKALDNKGTSNTEKQLSVGAVGEFFKKNWYYIAGGSVALAGGVYLLTKNKKRR